MWFRKVRTDLSRLPDCLDYYEREATQALSKDSPELSLSGSLEKNSQEIAGWQAYRYNQLYDLNNIIEYLQIMEKKERSRLYKMYTETYDRKLQATDVRAYIDGEQSIIDILEMIVEVQAVRDQFVSIMKGLDTKAFQISNITKIRTAGLEDIML